MGPAGVGGCPALLRGQDPATGLRSQYPETTRLLPRIYSRYSRGPIGESQLRVRTEATGERGPWESRTYRTISGTAPISLLKEQAGCSTRMLRIRQSHIVSE